ncbi:MAG: amidohydrolase [Chloroflexi bacterium]|nr:amidohydrolase [Chloroflexota bacterium]
MIIDAYSHMMYGRYMDKLAAEGGDWAKERVAQSRLSAQRRPQSTDLDLRLAQLDKYGIDLQVVTAGMNCNAMPGDIAARLTLARAVNNNMARLLEDSKGRLIPIGTIPLAEFEKGGQQEADRAIDTLGLKGFIFSSHLNGKPLDLPEFEPFWAYAAVKGIAIYIHPAWPVSYVSRPYEGEYDLSHNFGWPFETALALSRLVFSGIMERYPNLKIVSHHLGGMIPFFWGRTNETYHNGRSMYEGEDESAKGGAALTRPLFDYFSRFYYDTAIGGSAPALRCAYEVFGADQLVFATDAPLGPRNGEHRLETYPRVIKSLGLPETDVKKIFEDNTRRLLNLT